MLKLTDSTPPLSQYEQLSEPLTGLGYSKSELKAVKTQRSNSQRLSDVTRTSLGFERRHSIHSYNGMNLIYEINQYFCISLSSAERLEHSTTQDKKLISLALL